MKYFNIDVHISVIEDIKTILSALGHEVDSWCISGHNWVFNRQMPKVDVINRSTWKNIDQGMCDRFYERYKDELSSYDGFIACYPPVFACLYEKFNKPIYMVVATRYDHPCSSNKNKMDWLDSKLVEMIDNGQIIPIANNKYDKFYCEYFLDREFIHIPSICSYTNEFYTATNQEIVSGKERINKYKHMLDLGKFKWSELYSHKAIIHVPYNVSLMSVFEQYCANVPLLVPTIEFGRTLKSFMSELLFLPNCRINNLNIGELVSHATLSLSDFYDYDWMPYIIQYNSFGELEDLIHNIDFNSISIKIKKHNETRKKIINNLWKDII